MPSPLTAAEAKTNILSGLTVALALVPEALAFAFVAHVGPLVGLYAAFILCLITAAWGGRPGMISGATGALAVVMVHLVGVMFVVCAKTFEWGSFRIYGKVPRHDFLVMVLVTVVTIFTDLAIAVVSGVIISALVFAWRHAKEIDAANRIEADGTKVYELEGTLFFASVSRFQSLFAPKDDPREVVIEFRRARVADHSAIEAIDALIAKYEAAGKRLHLRHLSADCRDLLRRKGVIDSDPAEDPRYHVADNQLG